MISSEYAVFRRRLLKWYGERGRNLPWRATSDPYHIWISEIMLQQTTVVAVIPYFERFLARFPNVQALAAAEEADVLRLWEGLGYYSRARNLRKAGQAIVDTFAGDFPTDIETLQSLPGIGRYTAGAIASFAFDQRAPIVEANTLRLYCRLLGYDGDPRSRDGQTVLWQFAEDILPASQPGRLNQAMMELGATICSPKNPRCEDCPVRQHCRAHRQGQQGIIPIPKTRVMPTDVREVSVAIRNGAEYLLRKRTSEERWAGLWDFIRFPVDTEDPQALQGNLITTIEELTGLAVDLGPQIALLKHAVTRYRITLHCFTAKRIRGRLKSDEEWNWATPPRFEDFPMSVTGRQLAERLHGLH